MEPIRRIFGKRRAAEVSVLIPAYMAEAFIDRTLHFARGQTCRELAIIVSVDAGNDNTADIARRHAKLDPRVLVYEHKERLGWAENVNFLIEKVKTPYFFIYFHDDIILPQYTENLLSQLKKDPDAAGAYCDMGHFGASDHISSGPAYAGDTVNRLLLHLLTMKRGSPLRALLRSSKSAYLRMPDMGSGGFWANQPFLMDMLVAGPLLHSTEVLYLRWDKREGGLTEGWREWSPETVLESWRQNIDRRLQIIKRAADNETQLNALTFALFLSVFPALRNLYHDYGPGLLTSPGSVHPALASPGTPELLADFGGQIEALGRERYKSCAANEFFCGK